MARRFVPRALRGQLSQAGAPPRRPTRPTRPGAPGRPAPGRDPVEPADPAPASATSDSTRSDPAPGKAAGADARDGEPGGDAPAAAATVRRPSPKPRRRPSPRPRADSADPATDTGHTAEADTDIDADSGTARGKPARPLVKAPTRPTRSAAGAKRPGTKGQPAKKGGKSAAGRRAAQRVRAEARRRSALRRLRVASLVLAIVVLVSAAGAVLTWRLSVAGDITDASATATSTAQAGAVPILSYDYRTFDTSVKRASKYLGGKFAKEYPRTMAGLKSSAVKEKATVRATVSAVGVLSASRDTVVVLLYVDQYRKNTNLDRTKVDQNRVRFTMTRTGNAWKVTKVTAI